MTFKKNRWGAPAIERKANPTVNENTEVKVDTSEQPMVREAQPQMFTPVETNGCSIGVDIMIGRASDFSKNKYSVTIRTNIPCMNTAESRGAAAELGRDICVTRIKEIESEIVDTFGLKGIDMS